jgi:hypothetical protein
MSGGCTVLDLSDYSTTEFDKSNRSDLETPERRLRELVAKAFIPASRGVHRVTEKGTDPEETIFTPALRGD